MSTITSLDTKNQEINSPQVYTLVSEQNSDEIDIKDYIKSEEFKLQILQIIRSLSKNEPKSLSEDPNPLDNIIRQEVYDYLEFRRISKLKIKEAKQLITLGQNPYTIFTNEESLILLNQALKLEHISNEVYITLLTNPNTLYNSYPNVYKELLDFQELLPSNIPTLEELRLAGIVQFILTTVRENPEAVIDEKLIEVYTNNYIDNILLTSEFIGYTKATQIYANPQQTLLILNKTEFRNWAKRVGLYLKFVDNEKIQAIEELIPSQYLSITEYFTPEQLRLMVDKEIDIKNLLLKSLTFKELQTEFNKLAEHFKVTFKELFTNETILELIYQALIFIYKEFDINKFYKDLEKTTGFIFSSERIAQIENYLSNLK